MGFGGEAFIKRASSEISILISIFVVLCTVYLLAGYAFIYVHVYIYIYLDLDQLCALPFYLKVSRFMSVTYLFIKKSC